LAPFFSTPTFSETPSTFTTLHSKSNNFFPLFLEDYEPNHNLELSFDSFKLTFQHMSNLSISGHFGMVFEHFYNYFHLEDYTNGFSQLFQLCFHITQGHILHQITHILGVAHFLTMTKFLSVCPIVVGET
jgi:hypothetical protein